jgi:hypothetical protein
MAAAANSIIFIDAFKKVLGKCFVDVGTKGFGRSSSLGTRHDRCSQIEAR